MANDHPSGSRVSGTEFASQWHIGSPGGAWQPDWISRWPRWKPDQFPNVSAGRNGLGTPGHFLTLEGFAEAVTRSPQEATARTIAPRRAGWHFGARAGT